ncbi:hypothetical protein QR680_010761 [Steinernema hermaphroditum]|uniref:C-type lectin domain-containing protein n=1 Tax=Steinernema hermaphroditum TaxID=289476 RepID=A0AA39MBQ9_9BILA|nr:hypothetical protein QR680_010761 [Steinernema hermaphroditum]
MRSLLFVLLVPAFVLCSTDLDAPGSGESYDGDFGLSTSAPEVLDLTTEAQLLYNRALDLVFVIDQSVNGEPNNFNIIKNEVARVVRGMNIGSAHTQSRVGLVTVSSEVRVSFCLDAYDNKTALAAAIEKLEYKGDGRNIADGICLATKSVFDDDANRADIPDVMVIITDGHDSPNNIKNQLEEAKKQGIEVYAVAVRKDVKKLEEVIGSGNLFAANTFAEVEGSLARLFETVSKDVKAVEEPKTGRCSQNLSNLWLDMVFVLDSSMGVNRHDFNFQKALILGLLREIKVSQAGQHSTRIAFVNVGERAHRIGNLTTFKDNLQASHALRRTNFLGAQHLNVGDGLSEAQKIFTESDQRPNVRNVVVLFSSKKVDCHTQIFSQLGNTHPCRIAASIQQRGAVLITVAMNFHETAMSALEFGNRCFATKNDHHFKENFIRMALRANCFCHAPYKQLVDMDTCESYGECLYLAESPTVYHAAVDGCDMEDATIADVFDDTKEKLVEQLAAQKGLTPFWIGLSNDRDNKRLKWDSGENFSPKYFHKFQNATFNGRKCTAVVKVPSSNDPKKEETRWVQQDCSGPSHYYFCQRKACDADHYCY